MMNKLTKYIESILRAMALPVRSHLPSRPANTGPPRVRCGKFIPVICGLWAAAVIALAVGSADAQVTVYQWQPSEPDNWNKALNWLGNIGWNYVPNASD